MISALCDNIDGSFTFISYFCIQTLNLTLSKDSGKKALNFDDFAAICNIDNSKINLIGNCSFFKYTKSDEIVETAILVLGLLTFFNSKQLAYSSIVKEIEKVFVYYISEIVNHQSELVRCRYAFFLGKFIDLLFNDHPYAFKESILFLYRSVDHQEDKKVIALQSINTLKLLVCRELN